MSGNTEQLERWDGASGQIWVENQPQIDRAIGVFGARALEEFAAQPGECILDVGCGAGATTLALAQSVGESGQVLGLDASGPLLGLARERTVGLAQTSFVHADASAFSIDGSFDAMFSRFGVMFFDRPDAAFANLRRALRPGARLVFVCWQGLQENAWVSEPVRVIEPFLVEPAVAPEPHAPGPFAFAEPSHVERQLSAAGFSNIEFTDVRLPVTLSDNGVEQAVNFVMRVGPGARMLPELEPDAYRALLVSMGDLMASVVKDEVVALDGAAWLVTARSN